jgi:hypothetical protein
VAATRTTDPAARVELVTAGPVPATGDRDALLRAVRNLLDNAFAVADTVVVEVTQTANGPTMSVTDNGPGSSLPISANGSSSRSSAFPEARAVARASGSRSSAARSNHTAARSRATRPRPAAPDSRYDYQPNPPYNVAKDARSPMTVLAQVVDPDLVSPSSVSSGVRMITGRSRLVRWA